MEQRREGADRDTLASTAASPAQIGPHHGSTAGGEPNTTRSTTGGQPKAARAYAWSARAEIERDMAKLTALMNEHRARRGAELAAKCADWMAANPDALRYIERRALEEEAAQRPFSVRLLLEEARRKDFTDREGRGTRINNVIAPALARRLVEAHPGVRRFVKLRRSMVDEIEG